jgi:general secretion pathway protein F
MQTELLLLVIVKALAELAFMFLLGRGALYVLAGSKREGNIFYSVLRVVTDPVIRATRWLTPRLVLDAHIPFVSLFVLVAFVIPRFIPLFEDAGAPLPVLTQAVFGIAAVLKGWWWALVGLAALGATAAKRWRARAENRHKVDRWLLTAPVVGELVQATETVRFARTLETLLRNGLPLLAALKLTQGVQRNRRVAAAIETATSAVRSGGRLAPALAAEQALPSLAVELMTIGEESGQLESMLGKAAETFETRVEQKLKRLLTLLEPVLILGLGAVIALVIVSILMAMLGLNELVA